MYEISVKSKFDAAHQLRNYSGKCANIHGHTWDLEVYLKGTTLNEQGMLIDFSDVKEYLNVVITKYDHRFINEVAPFDVINPTAENLAFEIYNSLKCSLPTNVTLAKVIVWESPNASATYSEEC